ncbi:MAG: archaeosortase/exosortase family protein [Rubricoccaceae bacterium]
MARPFASHCGLARFAVRMAAVYAAWFVAYDLFLLPRGTLDAPLSHFVTEATAAVVRLFGAEAAVRGREVWMGAAGVYVADGCNGLAALSLFVGFVLAYPGTWRRRAWFVPAGLATLVAVNVLRCAFLLYVQAYAPLHFDTLHAYLTSYVFYAVIFALWMAWTRVGGEASARGPGSGAFGAAPATTLTAA